MKLDEITKRMIEAQNFAAAYGPEAALTMLAREQWLELTGRVMQANIKIGDKK